jgi:hypothetical protein
MRRVEWLGAMLIAAAAAVAGCGSSGSSSSGGGQASCTMIESAPDGGAPLKMCEELTGSSQIVESVRQICMSDAGVQDMELFANGPCSRVGALGGCSYTAGTTMETIWYYADSIGPQTAADVQMICTRAGDTFVAP